MRMIQEEELKNPISSMSNFSVVKIDPKLIPTMISSSSDMMLLHGYSTGPSLSVHPSNHAPGMYIPNLGHPRPMYKPIKEETVVPSGAPPSGAPQQPLYPTSISLIPQLGHQGQTNPKRSHSPSPPPPQMYHTYKPPGLSSYNSSTVNLYFSRYFVLNL